MTFKNIETQEEGVSTFSIVMLYFAMACGILTIMYAWRLNQKMNMLGKAVQVMCDQAQLQCAVSDDSVDNNS